MNVKLNDNVVICYINTANNKELLENCPHRDMYDMSIIYRIVLTSGEDRSSVMVTNYMAQQLGVTEDELYSYGLSNTENVLQVRTMPLVNMIDAMMKGEATRARQDMPSDIGMVWVSYTPYGHFGSSVMACQRILTGLADRFGTDLYILPASVHECLILPAVDAIMAADTLAAMLHTVNSYMDENLLLSNYIYRYGNHTHTVIAADLI